MAVKDGRRFCESAFAPVLALSIPLLFAIIMICCVTPFFRQNSNLYESRPRFHSSPKIHYFPYTGDRLVAQRESTCFYLFYSRRKVQGYVSPDRGDGRVKNRSGIFHSFPFFFFFFFFFFFYYVASR